jgi:hypothetical protein
MKNMFGQTTGALLLMEELDPRVEPEDEIPEGGKE